MSSIESKPRNNIIAGVLAALVLALGPAWAQAADVTSLNGVVRMHQLGCDQNLSLWTTGIDEYSFDGAGNLTASPVASSQGPSEAFTAGYQVDLNGVWQVDGASFMRGMVSPARDFVLLYELEAREDSLFSWVGIPKSSGLTNQVVSGDYRMHHFGHNWQQGYFISQVFAMTADGAGNGAWQLIADSRGQGSTQIMPWTYSVGEDGVSYPSPNAVGMVSADGGKIVSTVVDPAQPARVRSVALKLGGGMTAADLVGVFIVHEHEVYDNLSQKRTGRLAMTFDGAGGVVWESLDDSSGGGQTGSGAYTVEDNGALSLVLPDRAWLGTLSADGNVLLLSDCDASDGNLAVNIGIKEGQLKQ